MLTNKFLKITNTNVRVLVFLLLLAIFSVVNPAIISPVNIIAMLNNMIFVGLLSIALMLSAITANIDLSIAAIALISGYGTIRIFNAFSSPGSIALMFPIAALIGLICGLFNALIIYKFKLPGVVVSVATQGIYYSILFIGSSRSGMIPAKDMPVNIVKLNDTALFNFTSKSGLAARLNISILILLIVYVAVWFLLNKTMIGRGIFALGGNYEATERMGFNIPLIYAVAFGTAGAICGMAGIYFYSSAMLFDPIAMVGKETNAIAAIILGGTQFVGGKGGSVLGTLTGVATIVLIRTCLVMLKVPSYAQLVVIGSIILLSISLTSFKGIDEK